VPAAASEAGTPSGPPGHRKLKLTGAQETLVIPLYARALDYRSRHSILHDAKADEIVRSLDYDFGRLRPGGRGTVLAVRNRQIDVWVEAFLRRQPNAVVLNLGCGLDTRRFRLNPPATVLWFDVDLPEVVALRRTFFDERPGYRMLAGSLTEPGWLAGIPSDRPVVAVADGVLEYLAQEEVRGFLGALRARFAHGEAIFDVMNAYVQRMGNERLEGRSTATLRWAVDDISELDAMLPGYRRSATARLIVSRYLPWGPRLAYALAYVVPRIRNAIRVVRYDF
jgi:O-methyltransferase involved in polyketide biosynthesis